MGCSKSFTKMILIAVNIVFFLAGAAILGIGIYIKVDPGINKFIGAAGLEEFSTLIYNAAYVLIAFGAFTFVVGFCGCCGAIRESKCLISIYITAVVLVIAAEIAGGVLAYVKKDEILKEISDTAGKYLHEDFGESDKNASTEAWGLTMKQFQCCGYNGPSDFENSYYYNTTGLRVPLYCCKTELNDKLREYVNEAKCKSEARLGNVPEQYFNTKSCNDEFNDLIKGRSTLLMGIGLGIAGFELIVVLSAIIFCCGIDKDD